MPSEMILGVVRLDIASSQKPWGSGTVMSHGGTRGDDST